MINSFESADIDNKTLLFILTDLALSFGSAIIGMIFDCRKFKPMIIMFSFLEIFLMVIIIIFGIHYIYSYIIIFFGFFVSGACIVIYYAEITKIFGILSGLKLLSINSIIIGIINLIMLCLKAFIFDKDFNYIIMHIFCIILCIVKMVISSYIKEKIIFSNPLDKKQNIGQILDIS